jgi:alkylresorcinol/alkylpyrone synthase
MKTSPTISGPAEPRSAIVIDPATQPHASVGAPRLISVATALPPHRVDQDNAKAFVATLFAGALDRDEHRLLEVFDHSGVESRRVCMPLDWYGAPHRFKETNDLYLEHALDLAGEVTRKALGVAGLQPRDIDHLVLVTSTGVATPSLDARLANVVGFRSDFRRTPIWGLGCAGGAVGLSRARDFALADPSSRVLLIALELCSLTFQHADLDRRNLVASSLFSDGAAAAIVAGSTADLNGVTPPYSIEVLASQSTLWPDTLDIMGWEVDESGLHVVFSRDIPSIVRNWVRPNLETFLANQGLELGSLAHMIAHPGGPKVLAAYGEALGLPPDSFRHAREVLRTAGNMSSPTCLFVLERAIEAGDFRPGDLAAVAALGPGFSSEIVLIRATSP